MVTKKAMLRLAKSRGVVIKTAFRVTAFASLRFGWTGGRVVEGARLERVYRGNSIEGSNPSLSAIHEKRLPEGSLFS
jgi:hypothetical protein